MCGSVFYNGDEACTVLILFATALVVAVVVFVVVIVVVFVVNVVFAPSAEMLLSSKNNTLQVSVGILRTVTPATTSRMALDCLPAQAFQTGARSRARNVATITHVAKLTPWIHLLTHLGTTSGTLGAAGCVATSEMELGAAPNECGCGCGCGCGCA